MRQFRKSLVSVIGVATALVAAQGLTQSAEVVSTPDQEDRLACFRELPKDPPIRARYRRVPVSIVLQSLIERLHEQHPEIHIFVADDLKVKEVKESETQTAPAPGLPGPVTRTRIEELPREERTVSHDFLGESFRDALLTVVYTHDLECVKTGDVYRIRPIDQLKKEIDARRELELASRTRNVEIQKRETELRLAIQKQEADLKKQEADIQKQEADVRLAIQRHEAELDERRARFEEEARRGPVREETIQLRYADAEEVAKTIQGILGLSQQPGQAPVPLPQLSQLYSPSPPVEIPSTPPPPLTAPGPAAPSAPEVVAKGLTVQAYKPNNSVFIRYYSADLDRIKRLIEDKLDVAVPQIQIAAQMVITTLNALEQIGVQWGGAVIAKAGGGKALIGQGFADPVRTGPGTPVQGSFTSNQHFTGNQLLPVDPATGLPVGGSIVNLPVSLLPTLAGPAGGLLLGLIGNNFNINLAIQALELQSKARTIAAPKAVTVENAKAVISRGFQVPFTSSPTQGVSQVQFKDALLKLEVTPRLIRERSETKIRMKVAFDNDFPDFSQTVQGNPSVFKRHQEAEVVITEGQRLVIGGVTNDVTSQTNRHVPLFGNIPVLGWLFRSREISSTGEELIVILTPSVIAEAGSPPAR